MIEIRAGANISLYNHSHFIIDKPTISLFTNERKTYTIQKAYRYHFCAHCIELHLWV